MKKLFFCAFIGILTGQSFSSLSAQTNSLPVQGTYILSGIPDSSQDQALANPISLTHVNARVLRNFNRFHDNAETAFWTLNDNHYTALFKKDDRSAMALFSTKGYLLYTVYYGREEHLPRVEKDLV